MGQIERHLQLLGITSREGALTEYERAFHNVLYEIVAPQISVELQAGKDRIILQAVLMIVSKRTSSPGPG